MTGKTLDRETVDQYICNIVISDPYHSSVPYTATITVGNVNESPSFTKSMYYATGPEGGVSTNIFYRNISWQWGRATSCTNISYARPPRPPPHPHNTHTHTVYSRVNIAYQMTPGLSTSKSRHSVHSTLDKGLMQRIFYPLLLMPVLKCPLAVLKSLSNKQKCSKREHKACHLM